MHFRDKVTCRTLQCFNLLLATKSPRCLNDNEGFSKLERIKIFGDGYWTVKVLLGGAVPFLRADPWRQMQ